MKVPNRREGMSIALFSNVKSPHILPGTYNGLPCVWSGRVWGGGSVCVSRSLCLPRAQVWLFVWSSDNFSIKMLLEQRRHKLVPFFGVLACPCPPFPAIRVRTRDPAFQVHETCGIRCKHSRQLSAQLSSQMCTHSLRASVVAANLEVYKWVMKQNWLGSSGINHHIKAEMRSIPWFLSPGKGLIKRTACPPKHRQCWAETHEQFFSGPGEHQEVLIKMNTE